MKISAALFLTVLAISGAASAKHTVEGTMNSMCETSVRNAISLIERNTIGSSRFELTTVNQTLGGSEHEIILDSKRTDAELGKKLYIVEVGIRTVGENNELLCEIIKMRSYIEQ